MPPDADDFITRTQGDILIVRFKTEALINVHDIERIHSGISALIAGGVRKLILDFKNVLYTSSATLGVMIAINKELAAVNGKMVVSHPEHLMPLLKVSKTKKLFVLADDPKQAMELF